MEKNKWVEDVLGSADSIRRADSPDMADRILSRTGAKQIKMGTSATVWRIAASVILLLALNVATIYISGSRHSSGQEHSQDAASLFGLGGGETNQVDIGNVFFGN